MKHNIFLQGVDSLHGFQSHMIALIEQQVPLDCVILTYKTKDSQDVYDEDKVCRINYDMCEHNRYREFIDFNDLLPLSRDVLEKMRPFESVAMQMLVRNFERDIYTFDECKHFYLDHLRFWHHILVTKEISLICFHNIPHHCHDYVIYALADVLGIKRCLAMDTTITGRLAISDRLDNAWVHTYELYREYRQKESVELPLDLESYYQALLFENAGKNKGAVNRGMTREAHIALRKRAFTGYCSTSSVRHRVLSRIKHGIKVGLQQKSGAGIRAGFAAAHQELVYSKRAKIKLKSMRNIAYYNSLTKTPDLEKTFIIFLLHLQPEATTLPQGDVFTEQETMIQILAKATEKLGISLLVKEHFVQPYRAKDFYDRLSQIRNVTLLHTDIDSKKLIRDCLATASCNGQVMNESLYNSKPTIIFGNTVFQGMPGVFKVSDEDSTIQALKAIREGVEIDQKDVRAYLAAFGDNSLHAYFDVSLYERDDKLTEEEGCKAFADFFAGQIRLLDER